MNNISESASILIREIQSRLDTGGIDTRELPEIFNSIFEGIEGEGVQVNYYPSIKKTGCCELAYIISLKRSPFVKNTGSIHDMHNRHIDCRKGIETLIQHVQACRGITKNLIFITADWDFNAYNEWKNILAEINSEINLEIYLLSGKSASRIEVGL